MELHRRFCEESCAGALVSLKVEHSARYLKLLRHLKKQITCRGIFRSVRGLTPFDYNSLGICERTVCLSAA